MLEQYLSKVFPRDLSVRASSITHRVHYFSHPRYPAYMTEPVKSIKLLLIGSGPSNFVLMEGNNKLGPAFTVTTTDSVTSLRNSIMEFATIDRRPSPPIVKIYEEPFQNTHGIELKEFVQGFEGTYDGYSRISPHLEFLQPTNAPWPDQIFEH